MDNAVVVGGLGIVGNATRKAFGIKDYFDLRGSTITLEEIAKKKRYVFICLPTPPSQSGHKIDDILAIIRQIEQYPGGQKIYIIRSTTTPGQCQHIMNTLGIDCVVHNPEFLTQSTWEEDIEHPDIIVVGSEKKQYGEEVVALYQARYRGYPIFHTDTKTSEMIKCAINTFYALKVVFANEIYDICQKVGCDYDTVREAMYARKWIGKNHLRVVFNGRRGVRGKCLPKDLKAFNKAFESKLLLVAEELNRKWL